MLTYILGVLFSLVTFFSFFMMVRAILFYQKTVEDESSEAMNQKTNQDLKEVNRIKQAQLWKRELEKCGLHPSLDSLVGLSDGREIKPAVIPYQTVFSMDEYYHLSIILQEGGFDQVSESYDGNFQIENLPVAVHVKNLVVHTRHLKDALTILMNKERGQTLSDKEREKKEELQKELEDCKQEIKSYCTVTTIRSWGDPYSRIVFNPYVAMDEEEMLTLISSTVKTEKPVFTKPEAHDTHVTSPALEELNTFLNENQLPDKTTQELIETMNLIERTLRAQHERTKLNNTLLEAKVLDATARKYHQIIEDTD